MSDFTTPAGPTSGPPSGPPTGPPPSSPPAEVLASGSGAAVPPSRPPRSGPSRKGLFIGGGVVAVLALGGAAAWAAMSILGTGPQPAEALPASTLGYASIDLDPGAGQKVEAFKTLRKFPAFRDEVGVDSVSDLRAKLYKEIDDEGDCAGLDAKKDIDPWLGDRAAVAAVDSGGKTPDVVVALQVKDDDKAEEGLAKIIECAKDAADSDDADDLGGFVVKDGWALIAKSEDVAKDVSEAADKSSLADDEDFKKWTSEAGDHGFVTLYAAPAAGDYLADHADDLLGFGSLFGGSVDAEEATPYPSDFPTELPSDFPSDLPTALPSDFPTDFPTDLPTDFPTELPSDFPSELLPSDFPTDLPTELPSALDGGDATNQPAAYTPARDDSDDATAAIKDALRNFKGAAVVFRFDDGGFEVEAASDSSVSSLLGPGYLSSDKGSDVIETLPGDTAVAVGAGFSKDWFTDYLGSISKLTGGAIDPDDLVKQFTAATGLEPQDVETLLGSSAAIGFDSDVDLEAIENSEDLSDVPIALKVKGDPDAIKAVLDKLNAQLGPDAASVTGSDSDGDTIVIGPSEDYRKKVLAKGKLGDNDVYRDVVQHRDGDSAVLFVNVNEFEDAIDGLAKGSDDQEFVDNLEKLSGIGFSSWQDGDTAHTVIRATTD